jgi:LPS export ABC transporter protein LptC
MKKAKLLSKLILPVVIAGIALLSACENDLKDLQKISASEGNKPVESYTNVDVIYSDSAKVKAHMTAPLMLDYDKIPKPYTEMPKGVKVIFYDANLVETGTITSEYAIYHKQEKTILLRKNVVGVNARGETFTTDELVWDENNKQISSDKVVHVKMTDGSIADGTSFVSDESLTHWKLKQGTGFFHVKSQDIPH